MLKGKVKLIALLTGVVLASVASADELRGTISYRERIALPTDATVIVRLEDSALSGPPRLISELRFSNHNNQVPFEFRMSYSNDTRKIMQRYQVRASIEVQGKPMFETAQSVRVIPGESKQLNLVLQKVGRLGPAVLDGKWTLVRLNGKSLTPQSKNRPPTITFKQGDRAFSAFLGVNNMSGSYESKGPTIQIKTGMQTLIGASKELMELENDYRAALGTVTFYRMTGNALEFLKGSKVVLRFEK